MGIIAYIILGLLAGAIAKTIMPGDDPGGIIGTTLIGIVGAFIGGIVGKWIFNTDLGKFFEIRTWLLAILGSLILLAVYRVAIGNRSER